MRPRKASPGASGKTSSLSPPPGKRSPPISPTSWRDLEERKSRVASVLDRLEYLNHSRDRLNDLEVDQTKHMTLAVRHKLMVSAEQRNHVSTRLGKSIDEASKGMKDQGKTLETKQTIHKRMDAITNYVANMEKHNAGEQGFKACKAAAKGTQPPERPSFPSYDEVFGALRHDPGQPRSGPLMAVAAQMSYKPPLTALRHGFGNTLRSSSSMSRLGQTM